MEKFIFCPVYIFLIIFAEVDINEATQVKTKTSFNRLHQTIKDLTHIFQASSSCIDLIFFNQHVIVNNVVEPFLASKLPPHIVFTKINMEI